MFNLAHTVSREVELEPHEGGELLCRYKSGEERRGEVELVESGLRVSSPLLAAAWTGSLRRLGLAVGRVVLA